MLDLGDLMYLIVLTEREIGVLQEDLNGESREARDVAAETLVPFDRLSHKLEKMYQEAYEPGCNYPPYSMIVEEFRRTSKSY